MKHEPRIVQSQPRCGRYPQNSAEQPTIEKRRHKLRREGRDSRNELKRSQFRSGATSSFGRKVLALVRVVIRDQACLAG
jgi:transcriptional accessory protein Tex/SPT6